MKKQYLTPLMFFFFFAFAMKSKAQWNLTGNSNATSTSILGTTNAIPLSLTTNNVQRLVIDANGKVGIGIAAPPNVFSVKGSGGVPNPVWVNAGNPLFTGFGEQTVGNADYILSIASSLANARPVFIGRRARGTLAAPTVVSNNDQIMSFLSSGYDGTAFQNPAAIDFYVDGTPSAGNVPGRISFVTGSNASTRAERLKIGNTGDITINTNQLFVQKSTGNVGLGTITPATRLDVKSTSNNVAQFNGAGPMYMGLYENDIYRGYLGSFSGAAEDVDFGTGSGNTTGKLHLTIQGTPKFTVDASGNVGVGTTAPAAKMDVVGNIKIADGTQGLGKVLTSDANGLANWANIPIVAETDPKVGILSTNKVPKWSGSTLVDGIITDNGSNVGIGTTIPAAKLDVKSTGSYVAQFNGAAPMYMGLFENDIYRGYLGSYAGAPEDVDFGTGSGNVTGKLHLTVQASPKLTIDAVGRVGIGTTSPNHLLHVNGGDLFVQSSSGLIRLGYEGGNEWQMATTGAGADLRWYTTTDGGTTIIPRHYFSQNGNMGVGGFSGSGVPLGRLDVIGAGASSVTNTFLLRNNLGDTLMRVRDDGRMGIGYNGSSYGRTMNVGGTGINFYTASEAAFGGAIFPTDTSLVLWSNSGAKNYLVLQPSWGNTGIGTYTPNSKLHVNGNVTIGPSSFTAGGQFELSLDQGRKPSTSTWTIVSDARLKNIDGSYTKGLQDILKLNPITYHYKNVGKRQFEEKVLNTQAVGFTAQDVQKVFPEAVGIDADGYLNLNIHPILIAQVNAIKEQQAEIETLKVKAAKVDELQKQIDELKAMMLKIINNPTTAPCPPLAGQ